MVLIDPEIAAYWTLADHSKSSLRFVTAAMNAKLRARRNVVPPILKPLAIELTPCVLEEDSHTQSKDRRTAIEGRHEMQRIIIGLNSCQLASNLVSRPNTSMSTIGQGLLPVASSSLHRKQHYGSKDSWQQES